MERKHKIGWMLFIALSLVSVPIVWSLSEPFVVEKNIWLPEQYSIRNRVNDVYLPVSSPYERSDTIEISFDKYTLLYQSHFAKANYTVTVAKDGTVYYYWESGGTPFLTKKGYGMYNPLNLEEVIEMPSDNKIRFSCGRDMGSVMLFTILGACIAAIISLATYEKIDRELR